MASLMPINLLLASAFFETQTPFDTESPHV